MPHLQFEINKKLNKKDKIKFINFIEESFSKIMQTGTDHIAISIKELEKENLSLGRAKNNNLICLMNLDIRSGRTKDQKIKLVKVLYLELKSFLVLKKNFNTLLLQIMTVLNLIFLKNLCLNGLKMMTLQINKSNIFSC